MWFGVLMLIYVGIGVIYWLLFEYYGVFYLLFWLLLCLFVLYVIVVVLFYFVWMDCY